MTLSSTVKRIFAHTFSQCENLETVIVNDGVEFLGAQSFNNLKKITSLTLPKSIKTCGQGVITNCPNLTDVYYQGTIEEFKAISWAYSYNGEELEKMDYDLFLSSGQNGITTIHCTNGDLSA